MERKERTSAWVSCAWAEVATLPVPMAQTGSYATTMFLHGTGSVLRLASNQGIGALPVLVFGHGNNRFELSFIDGTSFTRFALLECFANAKDNFETRVEGSTNFLSDKFGGLAKDGTTLRVTWFDVHLVSSVCK